VSDVDTYRLCGSDADVVLDTDGEWVTVEDYDRLTAELAEARENLEAARRQNLELRKELKRAIEWLSSAGYLPHDLSGFRETLSAVEVKS